MQKTIIHLLLLFICWVEAEKVFSQQVPYEQDAYLKERSKYPFFTKEYKEGSQLIQVNSSSEAGATWSPGVNCLGETILLNKHTAAVTCGAVEGVDDRYTFGLIDIENALPTTGRQLVNNPPMYHHPSWTVDAIGNVFGIAIDNEGNIYVGASSSYGSVFYTVRAIIRYGEIGGGANDLRAAGTIYKIDKITGEPTVFAQLPQLATDMIHRDCDFEIGADGPINYDPRRSGPGLGNLTYDRIHNQLFVTNFEDGRIYRLNMSGDILDTYDPSILDNGSSGIPKGDHVPFGLAVSLEGNTLFYGTGRQVWSIPLDDVSGAFTGTLSGSNPYNNYTGSETYHFEYSERTYNSLLISDLEFLPNGDLMYSVKSGCADGFFTSYNHEGASGIARRQSNGLYKHQDLINVSRLVAAYVDDQYGGVDYYLGKNNLLQYVASSGDILRERGPHGIAVLADITGDRLGAISYTPDWESTTDNDFKGVGGDVQIFRPDCDGCVGTIDTDGDGIANECDLDDDNDGIKDSDECTPSLVGTPFSSINGQTQTLRVAATDEGFIFNITDLDNSFQININGINIATSEIDFSDVATSVQNIRFTDGTRYEYGGIPSIFYMTGTSTAPIIRVIINRAGDVSISGSKYSGGPLLPMELFNGNQFNQINWKQTGENIVVISQKIVGPTNISGNGAGIRYDCDDDGDGIPNHLDPDSDNDGCPDAIEGTGTITYENMDVNNQIIGGIDEDGIPTVIGTGQGAGSAYDEAVTDAACNDEPIPFTCSGELFQVYGQRGSIGVIDLNNNTFVDLPNSYTQVVNAMGYNTADNLAYGIAKGTNQLVQVDATGRYNNLGAIEGMPDTNTDRSMVCGDFVNDGYLHVKKGPANSPVFVVDVAATPPQVVRTYSVSVGGMLDFAFDPETELLYGVVSSEQALYSINPINGIARRVGVTNLGQVSFGAMYADSNGKIYGIKNEDGNFYEFNETTGEATQLGTAAAASSNDGFSCPNVPLAATFDYSDAPSSYGDAIHVITSALKMGDIVDAETGSLSGLSTDATGDDTNNEADEDGVVNFPALTIDDNVYSVEVNITNRNLENVILYSWIDFDRSGTFDTDEFSSTSVASNTVGKSIRLTWNTIPSDIQKGLTFVRFRLTSENLTATDFALNARDGEVEDYTLTISSPCNNPTADNTDTDNDGIIDICDLDDDNDGILDVDECRSSVQTTFVSDYTSWTLNGNWANYNALPGFIYNHLAERSGSQIASGRLDLSAYGDNLTIEIPVHTNGVDNNINSAETANLSLYIDGRLYLSFRNPSGGNLASITTQNGAILQSPPTFPIRTSVSLDYSIIRAQIPNPKTANALFEWRITANGDDFRVGPITFEYLDVTCLSDTDNDGIPDHLDTDSDNDGCPDAIEGTGAITSNNLDGNSQITGGVDENGIPTIIGIGQSPGSAYDANTTTAECEADPCDPSTTNSTDTDSDGVIDNCDLDDDNDGILDEVECPSTSTETTTFDYLEWTKTGSWYTVGENDIRNQNDIADEEPTYTNLNLQSYPSTIEWNISLKTNGYAYQVSNNLYATFSFYIDNVKYAEFRNPTSSGIATITPYNSATVSRTTMPIISSPGEGFTEVTITTPNSFNSNARVEFRFSANGDDWNIGPFEVASTSRNPDSCPDYDNDGIPNHLDLDSDNDGCPDAIEGTGAITSNNLDGNSQITGRVDENGIPTIIGEGQGAGTAYDANSTSEICNPILLEVDAFSQTACIDNGTSSNPDDDYFAITVNANIEGANNTDQYQVVLNANADGTGGIVLGTQTYGTAITLGNDGRFMADGIMNYLITIRDASDNTKFHNIITQPVSACSFACAITATLETPIYNDNGTPNDLTDDTFTVVATISNNTIVSTQGWESEGMTGQYGQPTTFGPYPVDQSQTIEIKDVASGDACKVSVVVNMQSCVYTGECECCR